MIPLKLVKKYEDNSVFEVRFKTESGKIIGTIERIDGYYCFFTTPREFGSWSEDLLE